MTLTDPKEFQAAALHALRAADFSSVAQVQSVWSDSQFIDQNLHNMERERILKAFAEAPELQCHHPEPDEEHRNPLIAVYTGVAGAGKTQLLGQIRKATVAPRTQFLLVDMTGVNKFAPTVCLNMILSLLKPASGGGTQLQWVLGRIHQIALSFDSEDAAIRALTSEVTRDFDALVDADLARLQAQFPGIPLILVQDKRKHVLRALMMLGLLSDERFDIAYDWLQGAELERQVAERFRLPICVEPLDVIKSISWLTGFRGKTMLAFDQMDVMVHQFATASRGGNTQTAAAAEAIVAEIAGGLAGLWDQAYRTQILLSCLQQTWLVLKSRMQKSVMARFWPEPAVLSDIPTTNVAKRIVELRLRQAYRDCDPPYPAYPFTDDFFEPGITPRTLLQRCAIHREECLRLGKVVEAGKREEAMPPQPPPPLPPLGEEFRRLYKQANIDSMLQDEDTAEEEMGKLLEDTCELLLLEDPPPRHIEPKMDLEKGRSKKARTALHSRLCLIMTNESDREELFCFRAIQRKNANAFQSRLKAAITDSGINLELPFRRLIILRTQPAPTGTKTVELLKVLEKNGGRILAMDVSELQSIQALTIMRKNHGLEFEAWLRGTRPLRKLGFIQQAFGDYFQLIQPAEKPDGSLAPETPTRGSAGAKAIKAVAVENAPKRLNSIIIGKCVAPLNQKLVELPLAALTRHVLIRAGSGGGKTVLLKRLVECAAIEGVPSIVLDPGNDLAFLGDAWPAPPPGWLPDDAARAATYQERARVVVWTPGRGSGRPLAFSPLPAFSDVQDDPDEFEAAVQMAAGSLYGPTGASKGATAKIKEGLLAEAIRHFARAGGKTLALLVEFLRNLPPEAQAGIAKATKLATDMADTLQGSLLGSKTLLPDSSGSDPSQLLGVGEPKTQISVISLAGLSEANDERLVFVNQLAVALFTWIRKHPAPESGRVRGLLVIDEARDFIPSVRSTPCKDSLMRLAAQARKYGFGLLLATQNPTDIDHKASGQCATQFFGRAASPNVVSVLREAIEERGGSAGDLTQMEKGQFYFWSAESHKIPSKVQVPMCLSHHPDGKTLSEAEILERSRR